MLVKKKFKMAHFKLQYVPTITLYSISQLRLLDIRENKKGLNFTPQFECKNKLIKNYRF